MSELDFQMLTDYGKFCSAEGNLDLLSFTKAMRNQVNGYIRRKLQRSVSETDTLEDFSSLAALKVILSELAMMRAGQEALEARVAQLAKTQASPSQASSVSAPRLPSQHQSLAPGKVKMAFDPVGTADETRFVADTKKNPNANGHLATEFPDSGLPPPRNKPISPVSANLVYVSPQEQSYNPRSPGADKSMTSPGGLPLLPPSRKDARDGWCGLPVGDQTAQHGVA